MAARPNAPPPFSLQCDVAEIPALAGRYSYPPEDRIVEVIGPAARERGFYTRSEFIEVCGWKTERSKSRVARNSEEDVVETTKLALAAKTEALRIWIALRRSEAAGDDNEWVASDPHVISLVKHPVLAPDPPRSAALMLGISGGSHIRGTIKRLAAAAAGEPHPEMERSPQRAGRWC